jgi:hypothetical protein
MGRCHRLRLCSHLGWSICQNKHPNHAKLVDVPQGPQTERKASAFHAGSGGAVYGDFPFLPQPLWDISPLQGSSPVRSDDVCSQLFVRWSSRVNGPCWQSRGSLSNVGLINRINMVMGYNSNGRGQGGHLTWLSPPLFMVN